MAIPLAMVFRRRRETYLADESGNKRRAADRLAKKFLGSAKKSLGNKEVFYEALERALHNYLKAKLGIETSEFTKDKIELLLTEREVSNETVNSFLNVL